MRTLLASCLLLGVGCGGSSASSDTQFANPDDPAYAASFEGELDPRVSTSAGEPGGYVVLWPRIVPADPDGALSATASAVQQRLVAMVNEAAADHPVDVRPDPERVCPRAGCRAASVGAALLHRQGSCALVAITAPPGTANAHLDPWVGRVEVLNANPPFRDPPEQSVRVEDFVPCGELIGQLDENADVILESVRSVRRSP
ncbi:MAG: hypothetical protein H6719_30325 [Sandaracinaceae bacterium]|nr:hypothetical protein [Sandaracinaceae bacterium]